MNFTPSEKKIISERFDSFIKKCCRNEARNIHKSAKRIYSNEVVFSCIENIDSKLFIQDVELSDFTVKGNGVFIENMSLLIALHIINDRDRELILLKFFMGYSDDEISKELNINRRTVSDKKTKIIKRLKEFMEENNYGKTGF